MGTIEIRVNLFAGLGKKISKYDLQNGILWEISGNSSVQDLLNELDISYRAIALVIINGKRTSIKTKLKNGDNVSIFPPIGGG